LIVTSLFGAFAVSTAATIMAAGRSLPEFPGDELLESHHVTGEFRNTFRGFVAIASSLTG